MKYRTTKKETLKNYDCLSVGYGRLQYLLHFEYPEGYTVRAEGWAADIYNIGDGVAIVTGYAPFGKNIDYNICKKYDKKAERILYQDRRYKTIAGKIKALEKLIENFRREAMA